MYVNKQTLTSKLSIQFGLSPNEAKDIVDFLFETIRINVVEGEQVKIRDFGSFLPVRKAGRGYRHPGSGDIIDVPDRMTVKFQPGKLFVKGMISRKLNDHKKKSRSISCETVMEKRKISNVPR